MMDVPARFGLYAACAGVFGAAGLVLRRAVQEYRRAVKLDTLERSDAQRLISPFAAMFAPQNEAEAQELRGRLVLAGLREDDAVKSFNYGRAMAQLAAVCLALLLSLTGMDVSLLAMLGVGFVYVAYKLPLIWLQQTITSRQARIERALPALIDLMVLCLDVGLSIESAFEKVTHEMQSMEPLMAEEARQMMNEMGAGVTFPQALKRLSDRCGVDELITMARLISQASGLGASITTTLREYSEAAATKRILLLEEKAGKVNAYLVMPLVACLLPASILALIGPAVLTLIKNLGL